MSKIGKKPIVIPPEVNIDLQEDEIKVRGPKGEMFLKLPRSLKISNINNQIIVNRLKNDKFSQSLHGLFRQLISNLIDGVTTGYEKKLEFKGVGFKVEVNGNKILLNIGFSHPVELIAPNGINFKVDKNIIIVSGIDKQKVGQTAADIRALKPVEPYKGKGIKYFGEITRRKAGKAAKAAIGAKV